MDELALLKRGLKTEVELAMAGQRPQSVVLLMREDRLPMAYITDSRGIVTTKVVSYADLLGALDNSCVVDTLATESTRTVSLPALPENTLLADVREEPTGCSYVLTGYMPPQTHLFCLETRNEQSTLTFDIPLPYLVWSALYDERTRTLARLSLTLCSPDRGYPASYPQDETGAVAGTAAGPAGDEGPRRPSRYTGEGWHPPGPDTPLYRYPFSNVYQQYGGALEGVCWPTMSRIELEPRQIPHKAVEMFLSLPNNLDLYGRGLSHNGTEATYQELLESVERGGLPEEYLIPAQMTVRGLHNQNRGE